MTRERRDRANMKMGAFEKRHGLPLEAMKCKGGKEVMTMTMTIEKAIELIQQDLDDPGSVDIMDLREAHLLCIEAMKRLQDMRISPCTTADETLPGETKE